jgi:DNA-binding transcriptional ArsR family regulator
MSDDKPHTGTSSPDPSAAQQPYRAREIDATAMKAFAHPLRMAMYEYLSDHGSATATMLANHTGESTGQTSYHLRQLERHGFVEDDRSRGTGRERWWKSVGFSMRGAELAKDSATRPAVELMLRNQVEQRAHALEEWFHRSAEEDPEWVNSSTNSKITVAMTLEETRAMTHEVMQLLHEHTERAKERRAAGDTDGVRQVRTYLDVLPLPHDE